MNLLLVDDHKLFREGMRFVLEAGLLADVELAGNGELKIFEACDTESAVCCAQAHPELDLVLLDLNLPDAEGLSALAALTSQFPILPVVILSASTERTHIRHALEQGAMGFIPKDSSSSAVINAIRLVLSGNLYVPPVLLLDDSCAATSSSVSLTDRQRDVIRLMAQGKSNKQIGRELSLAETTVKMHVTHIMRALDVSNRTQAVLKAEKLSLVAGS